MSAFDRRVLVVAGVVVAVLMALSDRYGFHGDELYMLDCARHLQASYVDQGVFAPLLARVSLSLFGVSEPGLRLWPALAAGATVVTGGLTAREFGGGRRAQLLAAVAVAAMPALLGAGHVANTTAYMIAACAALALIVARAGRTGDARWWLAGGVVTGIGTDDNHLVGILAVALTACAVASGKAGRAMILNRWFGAGALIAAALVAPDLWWQAHHGWATFAMTRALNAENGGAGNILAWAGGQLTVAGLATVFLWAAGLRFLCRPPRPPLWRAIPLAYGLLFAVYALTTGRQIYYLAGVYVPLIAAGAVALDGWLRERPARPRRLLAAMALTTAASAVTVLPVLPPAAPLRPAATVSWTAGPGPVLGSVLAWPELTRTARADNDSPNLGATIGWPALVSTVKTVWLSLPSRQRSGAVILTAGYSEAAAINELGTGLPRAVSGSNADWWWGPGNPGATTLVVVAPRAEAAGYRSRLGRLCAGVRDAAAVSNPDGVHNAEWGGRVYVCAGLRRPLGRLWPRLRHYG